MSIGEARLRRWEAAKARGDRYACSHCWSGQSEPGACKFCHRTLVHWVAPDEPVSKPLPPQPRQPQLTQPQRWWLSEQAWRKREGLPPLVPRTRAQQLLDQGKIPDRPGGALE